MAIRDFFGKSHQIEDMQRQIDTLSQQNETMRDEMSMEKAIKIATATPDFKYNDFDEKALFNNIYTSEVRPSGIANDTLRALAFKSTILSSIINRRKSQIECFGYRQKSKYDLGWRIVPIEQDKQITSAMQRDINKLSTAIDNLGFLDYDPQRGSFKEFLGLFIQDSLIFDGAAIEFISNRNGIPVAFKAIDGGAIHPRWDDEKKKFVYDEYINGAVNQTFDDGIIYCVRNKTTDRNWRGYGISEVERSINTITSHLFAEEYNKRLFKSSHFLSGVVSLKGQISREQLTSFRRDFYSFLTGVDNTNRVAIVNAPQGVEILNSLKSPSEMGFSSFMDYLLKVLCSAYLMDPVEVNFFITGGSGAQANPASMSAQEFRIKYSKDAGLRPLLAFVEDIINRNFINKWTDKYEFRFFGLDVDSKKERQSYLILSKKYRTLNEVRREEGLPDLPGLLGESIEDSGYMQLLQKQQQENAQPQDGENGQEYSEQELNVIVSYMKDSGYSQDEIDTVSDTFISGAMTFDQFKEYTGISDEEIHKYMTTGEGEDNQEENKEPHYENSPEVPKIEEPSIKEPESPSVNDSSKDAAQADQVTEEEEQEDEEKEKEE